jgi:hypothetical protein
MRGTCFWAVGRCSHVGHATIHAGIEDQVAEDQQESLQDFRLRRRKLANRTPIPIQHRGNHCPEYRQLAKYRQL